MERTAIAAVWRIWSQNGQTHGQSRKRHYYAYQLYGGGMHKTKQTTLLGNQLHHLLDYCYSRTDK